MGIAYLEPKIRQQLSERKSPSIATIYNAFSIPHQVIGHQTTHLHKKKVMRSYNIGKKSMSYIANR